MIPLRLWAYAAAALAIIAAIGWASHIRYRAGYEAAEAVMAQKVAAANAQTRAAEERADKITRVKDSQWQEERNALQNRVTSLLAKPAAPIRLCKQSPSRSELPAVSGATGQPDANASNSGSTMQVGDDLGPKLVQYGGDCETYRAQLSALQAWITSVR